MKGTAKPLPPPKSRSKKPKPREEIEVVFGLKQALIILVAIVVMFGGAFLWGVETGHTRAGEGKASLLAFLESKAAPAPGPVDIPDVLLKPDKPGAAASDSRSASAERPAEESSEPAGDRKPAQPVREREKPVPGIKVKVERPPAVAQSPPPAAPAPPPPARAKPAAKPAPRMTAPVSDRQPPDASVHFQIAAFKVQTNARGLVSWLRSEGLDAKIGDKSGDGLYRVYVGPFSNAADAADAKTKLAKEGFQPLVRRL